MKIDYSKTCQPLFEGFPERTRDVISRRFGLGLNSAESKERETLEAIGKDFNLTRERVRQIEEDAIARIKKSPHFPKLKGSFLKIKEYLKLWGGLKKESILFKDFDDQPNSQNWLILLLALSGEFEKFIGNREYHSFWALNKKSIQDGKKTIDSAKKFLEKENKISDIKTISKKLLKKEAFLRSSLEVSKEVIQVGKDSFGLKKWPEVNPRGVKDLAYLVFKKVKKPIHFTQVAKLIDEFLGQPDFSIFFKAVQASANLAEKKTHPQTVHNELIKDSRFVLVGRGTYALTEWGYKPGVVKEVITDTLKEAKKPLSKDEILKAVLSQRLVKENTILLNLHDRNCFLKTDDGKYTVREA